MRFGAYPADSERRIEQAVLLVAEGDEAGVGPGRVVAIALQSRGNRIVGIARPGERAGEIGQRVAVAKQQMRVGDRLRQLVAVRRHRRAFEVVQMQQPGPVTADDVGGLRQMFDAIK
jgi:hypothetical protein